MKIDSIIPQTAASVNAPGFDSPIANGEGIRQLLTDHITRLVEQEAKAYLDGHEDAKSNGSSETPYIVRIFGYSEPFEIRRPKIAGFHSQVIDKLKKEYNEQIDALIADLYVRGLSHREIEDFLRNLGVPRRLMKSRISERAMAVLEATRQDFKNARLDDLDVQILILDASYERAIDGGKCDGLATLIALAVVGDGTVKPVGVDIAESESALNYRGMLKRLADNGMRQPFLIISDAHGSIRKAISEFYPGARWQHCCPHFCRDSMKKLPKGTPRSVSLEIARDINGVYDCSTFAQAYRNLAAFKEKYGQDFPDMVSYFESGFADTLTFLSFPSIPFNVSRNSNLIENLNGQLRRRTRGDRLFTSIDAYERLVVAWLKMKSRERWTGPVVAPAALQEAREAHEAALRRIEAGLEAAASGEAASPSPLLLPAPKEGTPDQAAGLPEGPNPGKGTEPAPFSEAAPRLSAGDPRLGRGMRAAAEVNSRPLGSGDWAKLTFVRATVTVSLGDADCPGVSVPMLVGAAFKVGADGRREWVAYESSVRGEDDLAEKLAGSVSSRCGGDPGAVVFDFDWYGLADALPEGWRDRALFERSSLTDEVLDPIPVKHRREPKKRVDALYASMDPNLRALSLGWLVKDLSGKWPRASRALEARSADLLQSGAFAGAGVSPTQAASAAVEAKALSDARKLLGKADPLPDAGAAFAFIAAALSEASESWQSGKRPYIHPDKARKMAGARIPRPRG